MKKKYKCRLSASSLLVKVRGKVVRCEFEPSVLSAYGLRGCAYSTEDKDIQYAIEHSHRFHCGGIEGIWTDDIEPKEQEVNLTELPEEEVQPVVEKKVVRRGRAKKEV